MDFSLMDIRTVATGSRSDGTRYLQLFLQEYTTVFKEKVNPSCPKCLKMYHDRYKNYFKEMANTCKYRLHAKYENIPLEFGSPVLVNNSNITDEYAKKLLLHKNGERYFKTLPVKNISKGIKPPGNKKTGKRPRIKAITKAVNIPDNNVD